MVKSFIMKYWLIFAIIIIIIPLYFLAKTVKTLPIPLEIILTVLGWLLFIIKYSYDKYEKIYLLINRIKLQFSGEPINWSFNVEFTNSNLNVETFDKIWDSIKQKVPNAIIWSRTADTMIINIERSYTLRFLLANNLSDEADTINKSLTVQISDTEKPYNRMHQVIENQIIPLLDTLTKQIEPATAKFTAKIAFIGQNPYFGLYLRRLSVPKIISFAVEFNENYSNGKQTVCIRKNKIEITADSLLALQNLSLRYLTMSNAK